MYETTVIEGLDPDEEEDSRLAQKGKAKGLNSSEESRLVQKRKATLDEDVSEASNSIDISISSQEARTFLPPEVPEGTSALRDWIDRTEERTVESSHEFNAKSISSTEHCSIRPSHVRPSHVADSYPTFSVTIEEIFPLKKEKTHSADAKMTDSCHGNQDHYPVLSETVTEIFPLDMEDETELSDTSYDASFETSDCSTFPEGLGEVIYLG